MKTAFRIALFFFCVIIGIDTVVAHARSIYSNTTDEPAVLNGIHYQRVDGVQGIVIDGKSYILQCSIQGWKEQNLYIRQDLLVISDECTIF